MTRQRGRDDIDRLLAASERTGHALPRRRRRPPGRRRSPTHIGLAAQGTDSDPAGALQLAYDAARKAAAALLATQGLRATTRGGHIAVLEAARAQFNDKGGAYQGRQSRFPR